MRRGAIVAGGFATALLVLAMAACGGGPTRGADQSQGGAKAAPNLTGVWAAEIRYMDVGIPVFLRNTRWAPLSAGRPEDMMAQSFEQQSAGFKKLLDADADLFKFMAAHAFHPVLTKTGEAAAVAGSAARANPKRPAHPLDRCAPSNVVGLGFGSGAMQIMQSADRLVIVKESGVVHTVYLDGRGHGASQPSWYGHSVGRWNGKTLEVETTNFTGNVTFLEAPVPNSGAMVVRDYLTPSDDGKLLTIKTVYEDPEMLAEPVAHMTYMDRQPPDYELIYSTCIDNALGAEEYAATIGKQ